MTQMKMFNIDIHEFIHWLHNNEISPLWRDPLNCPVALYLNHNTNNLIEVIEVYNGYIMKGEESFLIPQWTVKFLDIIDSVNNSSRELTSQECLDILEKIKHYTF
jgi:hypothetical protein